MNTLRLFSHGLSAIPTATTWYLTDIAESQGKQELFARQSPQRLKTLRENALIESAVSSNRIEGVEIDRSRVGTVVFGKPALRDRDEEEIRGYRQALSWIHGENNDIPITESTIQELHRLTRGDIWDSGAYKEKDGDIIETYPDGRSRIRFKTVSAKETPAATAELVRLYDAINDERSIPLPVLMAAFSLDFLCIHPFRDGNGRVSRLLLLLQAYHIGLEVGRYVSLERLIEQNKERYYETLEWSSSGWHEETHDPWPYIDYLLFILKSAYREMEERTGHDTVSKGEKTDLVIRAIDAATGSFNVSAVRDACPSVSADMIRRVMKNIQAEGRIECLSRGRDARWRKTEKW